MSIYLSLSKMLRVFCFGTRMYGFSFPPPSEVVSSRGFLNNTQVVQKSRFTNHVHRPHTKHTLYALHPSASLSRSHSHSHTRIKKTTCIHTCACAYARARRHSNLTTPPLQCGLPTTLPLADCPNQIVQCDLAPPHARLLCIASFPRTRRPERVIPSSRAGPGRGHDETPDAQVLPRGTTGVARPGAQGSGYGDAACGGLA